MFGISLGAIVGICLEGIRFVGGLVFMATQVASVLIHFWQLSLGALVLGLGFLVSGLGRRVNQGHFLGLLPLFSNVLWMEWGSYWFCQGGGGDQSLAVSGSNGFFLVSILLGLAALVLQKKRRRIAIGLLILEVPVALACAFAVGMASSGTWL